MAVAVAGSGWTVACRSALAAGIVWALTACASPPPPPPPPKPTTVAGTIEAAAQLNPSASQRPSPMLIRIYELKSATSFNGADFMALYQADQATLGAEVVAREELTLRPGESRPYQKTLAADTRFIAVFGAYRDLSRATWRALVPVQAGQAHKLTIRAGELALSATLAP